MSDYTVTALPFSPTGTTKAITSAIVEGLGGGDMIDILSQTPDKHFSLTDLLVVAVPVFGGRVPWPALNRLKGLQGKHSKAVAVVVYGNRAYDDALLELKSALEAVDFQVIAAGAFVAKHSIVPEIAANRPDDADLTAARNFGKAVRAKLDQPTLSSEALVVPGKSPYREYNSVPLKPKADHSCTQCGTCAIGCPVKAIPVDSPNKTHKELCITCMHCVAVCPVHARKLNSMLLKATAKKLEKVCSEPKQPETFL